MASRTWRMGGGGMQVQFDAKQGKGIGARIRMFGRVLGMELSVDEIVTVYQPPSRKTWESVGTPKLLVIDAYRMGFEIEARSEQAQLCIYIDYDLPQPGAARWLGRLLGPYYARWCVEQMLDAAINKFPQR